MAGLRKLRIVTLLLAGAALGARPARAETIFAYPGFFGGVFVAGGR